MKNKWHLYLHAHKTRHSSRVQLFYAVTILGHTHELSSGISIPKNAFDSKSKTIINVENYDNAAVANLHLQQGLSRLQTILKLQELQGNLSFDALLCEWKGESSQSHTYSAIETLDEFISQESAKKSWSVGTVKKFKVLRSRISDFDKKALMNNITEDWVMAFFEYLRNGYATKNKDGEIVMHSYRNTSLAKMLKQLRWWLRWCAKKNYYHGNAENLTLEFKGGSEPLSDIVYLSSAELHLLQEHQWLHGQLHLERVVDAFLFSCYCGLRYSDIASLRRYHIHDGQIHCELDKTHVKVSIPLNRGTSSILEKYSNWDDGTGRPFPVASNQKCNEYLKEACRICGINSPVTRIWYCGDKRYEQSLPKHQVISFHCARRTFITQALALGIPDSVLIQLTGHTSTKMLTRYQGIVDELKHQMMSKFDNL